MCIYIYMYIYIYIIIIIIIIIIISSGATGWDRQDQAEEGEVPRDRTRKRA